MLDPIGLLVGAGLLVVGYLVGRFAGPRKRDDAPTATCDCGHGLALHNRDTDRCHAEVGRPQHNQHGEVVGYDYMPCACRRYVGPVPADQIVPMRILPPQQ
jgi:hypothetical protein